MTDAIDILVIEDSAVIWRLIRASCDELGTFRWAADGLSGLRAALDDPPSLVILDIGLPALDGWGVLARLREDRSTVDTPVLILTAHADGASRRRARQGGASAFMTKPFRPSDLRETITVLLTPHPTG